MTNNYRNENIIQKENVLQNEYMSKKIAKDNNYTGSNNNNLEDLGNKFNQKNKEEKNTTCGKCNHITYNCNQIRITTPKNHNDNNKSNNINSKDYNIHSRVEIKVKTKIRMI